MADLSTARRGDLSGPDRLDAGDKDRPHQGHGQVSGGSIELGYHPLIAGEQAIDHPGGGRTDGEQPPGDMAHLLQTSLHGHVDTVIVARRQIDTGKATAFIGSGQLLITTQ